ncbi:uncharacterized protein LOC104882828 isoform X2 [Beta vulgaris subsp. vulgaris]|uniref:uncharacterized protein LOC104882828 isoform X2 n=1 Tax=Beta vulgaris subsp. vulgaris TaxID=3555 RepID=UPI00090053A8|nr:uncharacterized protein LOC104882828 isoform X2 [Beta vulgaris subsp. vulgaris]
MNELARNIKEVNLTDLPRQDLPELGNCGLSADDLEENNSPSGDSSERQPNEPSCGCKRACEDEELDHEAKRSRTGILESDSETQTPNCNFLDSREANDMVVEEDLFAQEIGNEAMKVATSLENVYEKFFSTACGKVTKEICECPLLKVIVCGQCKCVIEAKIRGGTEYELVEPVSSLSFVTTSFKLHYHANFKAKSKNDMEAKPELFFVELVSEKPESQVALCTCLGPSDSESGWCCSLVHGIPKNLMSL